ncbi:MAG: MTH938/NDUFAF3 family protein [Anaerolineales bacterium]|jgi:hypothetical protein
MESNLRSPKINELKWGYIEVDGFGEFKDVKLYPGGARSWNWTETGTEHIPGIQYADVEELLEHGAQVIVISQGIYGRLKIQEDTLTKLGQRGITTHVLKTKAAKKLYNELCVDTPVGGLFHSTC